VKRVYLDQCHWIRLEAAASGQSADRRAAQVLNLLRYSVNQGFVSLPLSAVHYMETYQRPMSRRRLAALMAELSRFHAIAGPSDVLPAELDAYLHERYGKPLKPQPLRVFGRGVAFAFGADFPSFRAREEVPWPPGERNRFEQAAGEALEFLALSGPPDGAPIPGWDENNGYREFGMRQVAHEQALQQALVQDGPATPRKIRDWVAATEVMDIRKPLNKAFARAGITYAESRDLDSAEGLTGLLRALPSRDVIFDLRRLRHADGQARWEPNDLNDLGALSVALPYCDIVVTEKLWRHLANQAGIPDRYNTAVLDNVGSLPQLLA
jgi:hypothetical protein